jgi:hypothetical protein
MDLIFRLQFVTVLKVVCAVKARIYPPISTLFAPAMDPIFMGMTGVPGYRTGIYYAHSNRLMAALCWAQF